MLRRTRPHILALTLVAAFAVSGAACAGDDDGGDRASDEPTAATDGNGGSTAPGRSAEAASFTIRLIAFTPTRLEVRAGSAVTWRQDDVATHTVTSGRVEQAGGTVTAKPDGKFDSGNISKGQNFQFTFSEPGEFPFFCAIHPATMTGVVIVT
jgi:plastocyanin